MVPLSASSTMKTDETLSQIVFCPDFPLSLQRTIPYPFFLPLEFFACLIPSLCLPHPSTLVRATFQLSQILPGLFIPTAQLSSSPALHHQAVALASLPFPYFEMLPLIT